MTFEKLCEEIEESSAIFFDGTCYIKKRHELIRLYKSRFKELEEEKTRIVSQLARVEDILVHFEEVKKEIEKLLERNEDEFKGVDKYLQFVKVD